MQSYYTTYRPEFSECAVWRQALGPGASLLVYNSPEWGSLDAKAHSPAGSSEWRCLISRGIGPHIYGPATTYTRSR